jgi:hypothetical protein
MVRWLSTLTVITSRNYSLKLRLIDNIYDEVNKISLGGNSPKPEGNG